MVQYHLSGGISSEFLKIIYDLSGGNPLFIELLLQEFLNRGLITKFGSFWYLKSKKFSFVPQLILDLTCRALNKLDKNSKDIILYSSLIDEDVFIDLFPHLLEVDKRTVIDLFEKLVERGWFIELSARRFRFSKGIMKLAVRETLSKTRIEEMFKELANVINRVDLPVEILSNFYFKSGNMKEAFEYSLKAGEKNFYRGEVKKAIKYLETAYRASQYLEIEKQKLVKLYRLLAESFLNIGNTGAAEDYLGFISKLWDDHEIAFLRYKFNIQRGLLREALVELEKAIKKSKDPKTTLRYKIHRLGLLIDLGEFERAIKEYERLYKKVRMLGDKSLDIDLCATVMDYRGKLEVKNLKECYERFQIYLKDETLPPINKMLIYSSLGMYHFKETSKAIRYLKEALKISREIGDLLREAPILTNIGFVWSRHGYQKEAAIWFERAQEVYKKIGDVKGEIIILVDLGYAYSITGKFIKAEEVLGEGIIKNNNCTKSDYLGFHLWHALIFNYIREGKYKEALDAVVTLEALGEKLEGYLPGEADLYRGIIYLKTGDYKKADEIYKKVSPRSEDDFGYYLFLAEYLLMNRRYEELIDKLSKPLELAEQFEFLWEKALLLRFLGLANLKLGREELAQEYLEEAIRTFDKIDNMYEKRRTEEIFASACEP